MIKLTVNLADGTAKDFYNPVQLQLNRAYATPCHQLIISLSLTEAVGEIAGATLVYEGLLLFDGLVDCQTVTADANGVLLTLECRSKEAVLLDNEVIPCVQYYTRLSAVVRRQAAAYGIQGVRGSDPYLSQFAVYKGASVWSTLNRFCRQTLGFSPRVSENGLLVTAPPGQGRVITVSNLNSGAWNYISVEREINRYEVLSEVLVNSRYGGYSTKVVNPDALGVRQLRLLNPTNEWANQPKLSAQEAIKASMLEKTRHRVIIPAIVRCDIGDAAALPDPPFQAGGMMIGEVTYALSDTALSTTLTLYDRRYI